MRATASTLALTLALLAGCGSNPDDRCVSRAGPAMVKLQSPSGTWYCIDRTEVSEADYNAFLKQTTMQPGSEHAYCGGLNYTYQPKQDPASQEGADCVNVWSPDTTPNRTVVCIDWCDAAAYCKWAGKRLCGKVGGGDGSMTGKLNDPTDPALDANASQWFNACSQGGKTVYPYGDSYDPTRCAGADVSQADGGGYVPPADVGTHLACRGQTAPYSAVLDMSGSVYEFTNECYTYQPPGSTGFIVQCAARGGSYASPAAELTCATIATGVPSPDVGFRCCKDL